jgi:CheY-like chemotaxis protein
MRLAAESKSIQLETTIEPNVPPVLGDPGRLQQVIWNLLSNAIKFTPDGGRIDIRLDTVKTQARIQVKDTGKGISPDFLPYIFEYFRQADSSMTRTQGGLGLGLAIVHHLVELHGGTVSAASPGEGQGATFTVLLPLQKRESYPGEMEGSEAEAASPCSPSSESDLEGLHVIVVDDDPDTREFLSFLLRQHHAEVQAFDAANLAFTAFIESPPDILISDIGMPQEDGYSLIKRIRSLAGEKGGGIPAIALTAYAREEDQQQALAAGFQTHLAKPVNSSELLTTILHLVED